jgi:hypothetical protein
MHYKTMVSLSFDPEFAIVDAPFVESQSTFFQIGERDQIKPRYVIVVSARSQAYTGRPRI